jgi:hypothetical protein
MRTRNVIRKDGWLYRLAYGLRLEKDRPTGTVNLCNTIWLAIKSIIAGIFTASIVVIVACVVLAGTLTSLWPIVPSIIAWLANPSVSPDTVGTLKFMGAYLFSCALIFALLFGGCVTFTKSEIWRLFAAYMRAKKEKVCPIYEVV